VPKPALLAPDHTPGPDSCRAVIDVYIEPLRSRGLLSKDELSTLFSNWEMLHSFNAQVRVSFILSMSSGVLSALIDP
jgi:hypothetical protein